MIMKGASFVFLLIQGGGNVEVGSFNLSQRPQIEPAILMGFNCPELNAVCEPVIQ